MKINLPDTVDRFIPARFSALGESINPMITWSGVPPETQEFALICEDPDAPAPNPFIHWVMYGISGAVSQIPEGIPTEGDLQLPVLARQGKNSLDKIGYTGPNPPFFHGAHRYIFRLFALKAPVGIAPGATRDELLEELKGKIIQEARFEALYEKTPVQRARAVALWSGIIGTIGLGAFLLTRRQSKSNRIPFKPTSKAA